MKWFRNARNKVLETLNIRRAPNTHSAIVAYHEAGHAVFAYMMRWKVKSIKLFYMNEQLYGLTTYDFGSEEPSVLILNDSEKWALLKGDERKNLYDLALRKCTALIVGPAAEARYRSQPVAMNGNDLRQCLYLESNMFTIFHESKFVSSRIEYVQEFTTYENIWIAIRAIADALLNSPNKELSGVEADNIVESTGLVGYIKELYEGMQ